MMCASENTCGIESGTTIKVCCANPTHGSGWIVQVQPTNQGDATSSLNPTHGSGWIVQVQPTNQGDATSSLNPTPRQWVDCSSPAYKRRRRDLFFESHPRQWVDRSGAAYKGAHPGSFASSSLSR